jgi:hypothetical protein
MSIPASGVLTRLTNQAEPPAPPHLSPIESEWDRTTPWWRPGFIATALEIGWWWLLLLPLVLLVFFSVTPEDPLWFPVAWLGGIKTLVMIVMAPLVLRGWAFNRIVAGRSEPFCIHCGHNLAGLPDEHRCPECGRRFSLAIIQEYRRDPACFIHTQKAQLRPPKPTRPVVHDRSLR